METIESAKQTRRMQLSGGSTYIISLPKNWIEELKIKVGQNVTIVKNSNQSLTLFSNEKTNSEKKTIAVIPSSQKDTGDSIKRKIIAAYLRGYNTIEIKSKGIRLPAEHSRNVRELVRTSMIGTEIVESSSEKISIQILTRLPELSFDTALKRMYLMASNMVRESIESIDEEDDTHADEVVNMDDEVDRFGLYMRRNLVLAVENENILQDMGLRKPSDCLGYRAIVTRIERIADHASHVAKRKKFIEGKLDIKLFNKIKKLSEESLTVFDEAINAVQNQDFIKGEKVAQKVADIIEDERQIMSKISDSDKNSVSIRFILQDLRRIAEYSGDIAEVAIDENIQSIIIEK
ncbi:Phosphate-specific transport system accessory protein PhoU [Marine Group I thaumarchaeote SCGC AAA799-E16]|uniref:Phosphate-specific transport system accessory protein PhoU n=2 Tax=Marine Group I TaxID=905826 RepID=A0A087RQJ7_9ARCH|nr:Phosphate-specific transport system accessory protein PhoU [Marine Group I thaumarchaeote SCGC AAA799-E16]KFM15751.1 Phosphate-specific transport system accessory protein PhoU [Marine Group I thaumarchaeote SCGC RSA3]